MGKSVQWLTSDSSLYTFPIAFTIPFTGVTYTTSARSEHAYDARISLLNSTTISVQIYGFRAIVVGI